MREAVYRVAQGIGLQVDGVAQLGAGDSVNDLLQRADEALYQAKTQGRDRACLAQRSEQPELALDQRSEVVTHEG